LYVPKARQSGGSHASKPLSTIGYDFCVRVQGAVNVDSQGGQRAFDQIPEAALRISRRGGLVNAQGFLE
jgi:hypothetical protein